MSTPEMTRAPPVGESATLSDAAAGKSRPGPGEEMATPTLVKGHERAAMRYLMIAAVIILVGTFLIWVIPSAAYAANGYKPLIPPANSNETANEKLIATTVSLSVGIGMFVGLLGFYFLVMTFRSLRDDDEGFVRPSQYAILGMPAVALFGIAALLLTPYIQPLIDCISYSGLHSACYDQIGSYIGGYYFVVWLGVILYLIGGIAALVGIWRLGSRYHLPTFMVGAILLIFPVLAFFGAILLIVGVRQARAKIDARAPVAWDG